MLFLNRHVTIPLSEIEIRYTHAQGPGGQHVNKAATAVHLRFDFLSSPSLPEEWKERLLAASDRRISEEGVIVIKAGRFRSQERNREDALERLAGLIRAATAVRKKRRPTAPTRSSREKRLTSKARAGQTKALRKAIRPNGD
ncbi:MAG: alternative ribosome rescue aminoacyl-tRNA hydrolase ArfB [Thermodesulfobacteriota bacterium]